MYKLNKILSEIKIIGGNPSPYEVYNLAYFKIYAKLEADEQINEFINILDKYLEIPNIITKILELKPNELKLLYKDLLEFKQKYNL